jgi:hypothetical protein
MEWGTISNRNQSLYWTTRDLALTGIAIRILSQQYRTQEDTLIVITYMTLN